MGSESGIPFGNYTLLKRIARGGMAEVFVARQTGLEGWDRLVAIKRILPHLLDDQSFVRMFQEEARLAARLTHPNIIHIYDFGKVDEHFFIAMEYMRGVHAGDLISHGAQSPLPPTLVARIGADACAGLHYAHNAKDDRGRPLEIVHRDVSPANLLVNYDGVVKLVDFGIAKAVSSIEQTRPGVVKGKYAYMSPEQTVGRKLTDRSDIFSLALVMWELLAGREAVTRNDQILAMKTIRDGKVPPIQSVREDVPQALAEALEAAMVTNPSKRCSAREFGGLLESFIKGSSELGSNMELSAWLCDHMPPTEESTGQPTRAGTRQATLPPERADSVDEDINLADVLSAAAPPSKRGSARGSVLARINSQKQEALVTSKASGDLSVDTQATVPYLGPGRHGDDSVVLAADLLHTDSSLAQTMAENPRSIRRSDSEEETLFRGPHDKATRQIVPDDYDLLAQDSVGGDSVTEVDDEAHSAMIQRLATNDILSASAPSIESVDPIDGKTQVSPSPFAEGRPESEPKVPMAAMPQPAVSLRRPPSRGALEETDELPARAPEFASILSDAPSAKGYAKKVAFIVFGSLAILGAFFAWRMLDPPDSSTSSEQEQQGQEPGSATNVPQPKEPAPNAEETPDKDKFVVTPLDDENSESDEPSMKELAVLEIASQPPGALIKVNGTLRGLAPVTLADLSAGVVKVEAFVPGHARHEVPIELKAGEYRSFEISPPKKDHAASKAELDELEEGRDALPEGYGRLEVESQPFAVVFHKERKLGVTPLHNVQLPAGRYKLELQNPDYDATFKTVKIRKGRTTSVELSF